MRDRKATKTYADAIVVREQEEYYAIVVRGQEEYYAIVVREQEEYYAIVVRGQEEYYAIVVRGQEEYYESLSPNSRKDHFKWITHELVKRGTEWPKIKGCETVKRGA